MMKCFLTACLCFVAFAAPSMAAITSQECITASEIDALSGFGFDVAVEGDTLAIATDQGEVYIFTHTDFWQLIATRSTLGGPASLSLDRDTLAVGSHEAESVRIFERDRGGSNNWGLTTDVNAPPSLVSGSFGWDTALDSDTLLVGAPADSASTGAVALFTRDEGGTDNWGLEEVRFAPTPVTGSRFGDSVGLDDTTSVVGSPLTFTGSVFVSERVVGVWNSFLEIPAEGLQFFDLFGKDVDVAGDTIVAGSPFDDDSADNGGSVRTFRRNLGGAGAWGQEMILFASEPDISDELGRSVETAAGITLAGMHLDDDTGESSGSAHVFGGAMTLKLTAPSPIVGDNFGFSTSISSDWVVVGGPFYGNPEPNEPEGIVCIYRLKPPVIFMDGFESGDVSVWSGNSP